MTHMYDITMKSITGNDVHLGDYRGMVSLVVNVASA
jgi:glutathione peroxidase-family protein